MSVDLSASELTVYGRLTLARNDMGTELGLRDDRGRVDAFVPERAAHHSVIAAQGMGTLRYKQDQDATQVCHAPLAAALTQ